MGAAAAFFLAGATLVGAAPPQAQSPTGPMDKPQPAASPIERLSPGLFRIGNIRIDTSKREISVNGVVNEARTLEFIAGTKGGFKNYETALELDTNAINFNLALILGPRGQLAEAILLHLRRAAVISPQNADVHRNLGLALSLQGRTDEAIEELQEALRIQPDSVDAQKTLAEALSGRDRTRRR